MINDSYLQCLPLSAIGTMASRSSTEFVTTSGTNFMLNGSKYTVVGWENSMLVDLFMCQQRSTIEETLIGWECLASVLQTWMLPLLISRKLEEQPSAHGNKKRLNWNWMIRSSKANFLCCRGFNEVTSANGTYYQIWSGSTPTINTGATGLQHFGLSTFAPNHYSVIDWKRV